MPDIRDMFDCSACGGYGVVPASAVLRETLELLRNTEPSTAPALADDLGISVPATNNRLTRLERAGMVRRDGTYTPVGGGSSVVWRAVRTGD